MHSIKHFLATATSVVALLILGTPVQSQNWNHKKAAVVLTYDDGLNVHLDLVVPQLDSAGIKGTFYIPGNSAALHQRIDEWRSIAYNGHELGNHTLFHPCIGNTQGREWVDKDYDLGNYSVNQIVNEIKLANTLLKAVDGKEKRTFAYTCGDKSAGNGDFSNIIKKEFTGARDVSFKLEKAETIDLNAISAFFVTNQTGEELINLAKQALEQEALIVFLFHGVGGEHNINIPLEEHAKLIDFLSEHRDEFWVAPMVEVTSFISESNIRH